MATLKSVILPVLSCFPFVGEAQQVKSIITPEDYGLFSRLSLSATSPGNEWVSYHLAYKDADTLFVTSSSGNAHYALPQGRQPYFIDKETFVAQLSGNRLRIVKLHSGQEFTLDHTAFYQAIPALKLIMAFKDEATAGNTLQLISTENGALLTTLTGVSDFNYNEQKGILAYIYTHGSGQMIKLLHLATNKQQTVYNSNTRELSSLAWEDGGKHLAFASKPTQRNMEVHRYTLDQQKLYSVKLAAHDTLTSTIENLTVSTKGRLSFTIVPENNPKSRPLPEIWRSGDTMLVPLQNSMGNYFKKEVVSWVPGSKIIRVNSDSLPICQYTGKLDYVLLRNTGATVADSLLYPVTDHYIADVASGKKNVMVKALSTDPNFISVCPINNNIAFYTQGNWHLYHPETGTQTNLTGQIKTSWDTHGTNALPPAHPFGFAGWTTDGKGVYLYDEYDIYRATTDGKKCERLTQGRDKGIVFRFVSQGTENSFTTKKIQYVLGTSDKDNTEYYYTLSPSGKLKIIDSQAGHLRQPLCSETGITYIFERFDAPPRVKVATGCNTAQTIFTSNEVQNKFLWGKSELITYVNSDGLEMKAALFYPAGYKPGEKYPMVTFVYQSMSDRLNHYEVPWDENGIGINITRFTLNGYLVLLPDIHYRTGAPGISAVECVTVAAQKVIDMGIANPGRLGLIGTSFGGYETAYIISQTKMFAAAVSGSMISDLTASYFSVGQQILLPELWRYETQIFRMGKPYFKDKEAYLMNSPLYHADKINTPLLIWCGKEDPVVPWTQSLSFYLAMRRLRRHAVMLAYSGESHALIDPKNQSDLSDRVLDWFGHYLKDDKANWITDILK